MGKAKLALLIVLLLSSCYSSTLYKPELEYGEVDINIVFDSNGFREFYGWGWMIGTLVFECDKEFDCDYYGWPEEEDIQEEWFYIVDEVFYY